MFVNAPPPRLLPTVTEQSWYASRTSCAQGPFVLDIPVGLAKHGEAIDLSVRTPRAIAIHATITANGQELAAIDDTFAASGRVGGNADNARCVADARERLAAERARRAGTRGPATTPAPSDPVTTPDPGAPAAQGPSAPPPVSIAAGLEVVALNLPLEPAPGQRPAGTSPVLDVKIPDGVTTVRVTWWSVQPNDLEGVQFGLSHIVWKPDIGEERYEAYLAEQEAKRIAEEKRRADLHEAWLRDEEKRRQARAAQAAEDEARRVAAADKRRAEAELRYHAELERREAERAKQRAEADARARLDFHAYFECRRENSGAICGALPGATIDMSGGANIGVGGGANIGVGGGANIGVGGGVNVEAGAGGRVIVETEEARRLRLEAELRARREAEARRIKIEADARARAAVEERRRLKIEADARARAAAEEQRRLKIEAELRIAEEKRLRAAEERKQFCASHPADRSCWGPGGLDMKLQLDARAEQAKAYCAQHHEDARCWTDDDRRRVAAADQARLDVALAPPSKPDGPPPAPLAETMPPRLSLHAEWRPGYWQWVDSTWVWLAGMWRVPEADIVAEQTTTAPIAPPALQVETPAAPPVASAVWTAGFWQWDGAKWIWVAGSWQLRPSTTVTWRAATWQARGSVHVLVPGAWVRIGASR